MVLESGLLQEREDRYELTGPLPPLAIPATLHDSLMARLDRLATVKALAQLGATLGREFSYELLQAVAPLDEATLQRGLHAVGGGGVALPAGAAAAGDLPLQACPDPGGGLSVVAARAPGSSTISALPRCWRRSFPRPSRPARAAGAPLHRGGPQRAGHRPTGSGRAARPPALGQPGSGPATSPRGWSCSRRSPRPRRGPSRSSTCRSPWGRR